MSYVERIYTRETRTTIGIFGPFDTIEEIMERISPDKPDWLMVEAIELMSPRHSDYVRRSYD